MTTTSAFILNVRLDNVAVVAIDVPGEKVNTLKAEFAAQVRAILKQIRENKALQGVVFISAKADNFIAGADINMIGHCQNAQEAETLARQGQQLMAEIQALPVRLSPPFMAPAWVAVLKWRWPAIGVSVPTTLKPFSDCRRYS